MRANKRMMRRIFAICICTVLITPSFAQLCYGAQPSMEQAHTEAEGEETDGETTADIVIRDTKDFVSFMENCKYDSWSIGKTVSLAEDLDLIGVNFSGVASFNGTFEGNGHTIRNVKLEEKGSDFGFFRYIGESGVVQNLHIEGTMWASTTERSQIVPLAALFRGLTVLEELPDETERRERFYPAAAMR